MTRRFLGYFAAGLILMVALPPRSSPADQIRKFKWEETLNVDTLKAELDQRLGTAPKAPQDFELRINICMAAYAVWRLDKKADYKRRLQLANYIFKYSKQAVELRPEAAAGHHWVAVGIGMVGVTRGILNSLQLVPQVKSAFEKSAQLDPDYLYASAIAQLGRLYTVLPGFPVSIGDRGKALAMLQDARKRAPNESLPLLYLADLYWLLGHKDKALAAIDQIFALRPKDSFQYFSLEICKRKSGEIREMITNGTPRPPLYDVTSDIEPEFVH